MLLTKEQISEQMRKHAEKKNGLHDLMEIMLESMMVAERGEFLSENPGNKGNGYRPGHSYGQGKKLEFRIPRDAFINWNRTSSYPYIIGDIVWTGLDYLGESGIGRSYYEGETPGEHYQRAQFPWHGAYCGDVDITGWRKPISHYRDMLWNPDTTPLVYMAVKEPNGYHGVIHETQWSVYPTWESWNWPGVLRCVALDANGNENKSCTLETSGAPAALRLTIDRTVMQANGQDLAYVTIEVVDSHGRLVPDAKVAATVNVSGAGSLAAAGSANLQDLEPLTSPHVTTWNGRAQAVIRASRKAGQITVSVTSELPKAWGFVRVKR